MLTPKFSRREAMAAHGKNVSSVEVDWALWQAGEASRKELMPHHRTLTVWY